MAGTATNILIGAAVVNVDGTDLGFTKGGTEIDWNPSYLEVKADQVIGTVKMARKEEKMTVKTGALEPTLANLQLIFDQPASNLVGSTLTLGYNNSCAVTNHLVTLTGVSPNCRPRTFTLVSCVSMGNKKYKMSKDEETVLDLQLECLKNASGNFGYIVDS